MQISSRQLTIGVVVLVLALVVIYLVRNHNQEDSDADTQVQKIKKGKFGTNVGHGIGGASGLQTMRGDDANPWPGSYDPKSSEEQLAILAQTDRLLESKEKDIWGSFRKEMHVIDVEKVKPENVQSLIDDDLVQNARHY